MKTNLLKTTYTVPPATFSIGVMLTVAVVYTTALLTAPVTSTPVASIVQIFDPLLLVSGVVVALVAYRTGDPLMRPALGLLVFGSIIRTIAGLIITLYDVSSGPVPFPSVADLFFLAAYPPLGLGIFGLARRPLSRSAMVRVVLDSAILVGAATVLLWQLFLATLVTDANLPLLARIISLSYPVLDLALLTLVFSIILRRERLLVFEWLFVAGLTCIVGGDLAFAVSKTYGIVPLLITVAWTWGFTCIQLGIWFGRKERPLTTKCGRHACWAYTEAYVPYLAIIASFAVLITTLQGLTTVTVGVLWGTLVVTLLVITRQILLLKENERLYRALAAREAELSQLARHDALTGLLNRRAFDTMLASEDATTGSFYLALIDLDGLKTVNDREGHARGDVLLETFAQSLSQQFRPEDRVYRLGGDEFAVVLRTPIALLHEDAVHERVDVAVAGVRPAGFTHVGASVGIATYPLDGGSAAAVLRLADERMYEHKRRKKSFHIPVHDGCI